MKHKNQNNNNRPLSKPSILSRDKEKIYEGPQCTKAYMRTLMKFLTQSRNKIRRFRSNHKRLTSWTQLPLIFSIACASATTLSAHNFWSSTDFNYQEPSHFSSDYEKTMQKSAMMREMADKHMTVQDAAHAEHTRQLRAAIQAQQLRRQQAATEAERIRQEHAITKAQRRLRQEQAENTNTRINQSPTPLPYELLTPLRNQN